MSSTDITFSQAPLECWRAGVPGKGEGLPVVLTYSKNEEEAREVFLAGFRRRIPDLEPEELELTRMPGMDTNCPPTHKPGKCYIIQLQATERGASA